MARRILFMVLGVAVALGAACGGKKGGSSPTPTPTPANAVTLVVQFPSASGASASVVVDDSAGALVEEIPFTADGTIVVDLPSHGSVTVAALWPTENYVFYSVKDPPVGTTLTFRDPYNPVPVSSPVAAAHWNVSASSLPAGAVDFIAGGPCGTNLIPGNGSPVPLDDSNCLQITSTRIYGAALSATGALLAFHVTDPIGVTPGSTTNVSFALDGTGGVMSETFTNFPAGAYAGIDFAPADPEFVRPPYMGGGGVSANLAVSSTLSHSYPAIAGALRMREILGANYAEIIRQRTLASVSPTMTFDLSGLDFPTQPIYDAPTATFSWTAPSFGEDGMLVDLGYGPVGSGYTSIYAVVPPGTREFKLPEMPAAFSGGAPGTSGMGAGSLSAFALASQNGYGDFVQTLRIPPAYLEVEGANDFLEVNVTSH